MIELADYDFLGSIYKNTNSSELKETLESIKNQTHQPKNIFLVLDGYIKNNVLEILNEYKKILPITTILIKNNVGLGLALKKGLEKCKSDIVLRFDTDDINYKKRAEYIVKELGKGEVDIVGSNVNEFYDDPNILISKKRMPLTHASISKAIFFRNPINHPSVGFLRKSILNLNGGYRHFPFYEDYDLWIRAFYSGLKFRNLDQELVSLRIKDQRARRKGLKLVMSELRLLLIFFGNSFLHGLFFIPSCTFRLFFTLLPLNINKILYKKFFRTEIKN